MKIMITGGCGFIGLAVTKRLVELGHDLAVLDLKHELEQLGTIAGRVSLLKVDIADFDELAIAVSSFRPDTIIHLAALRNRGSQEAPFNAHHLNCTGTVNVLEVARRIGTPKVVYASTVAVYGSPNYYRTLGFDLSSIREEMPPKPYNMYGVTKLYGELVATRYLEIYGLKSVGLRLSIVFGPGKSEGSQTSMFNDVIEAPVKRIPISVRTYAEQKINLLYLQDAVHGFVCACLTEDPKHAVYNIGGFTVSMRELVDVILRLYPDTPVSIEVSHAERAVASAIDSSLAQAELGYKPQFTLQAAIQEHLRQIRK